MQQKSVIFPHIIADKIYQRYLLEMYTYILTQIEKYFENYNLIYLPIKGQW